MFGGIYNASKGAVTGWLVDSNGRGHVDAVSFKRGEQATELGYGFNFNTGVITLTDATETSVLYIKNLNIEPLVITSLIYMTGKATGPAADLYSLVTVYSNPTAGTIITDAVDAEMAGVNREIGSPNEVNCNVYKGDTADDDFTTTEGKIIESIIPDTVQRIAIPETGDIVVDRNKAIGITITPPTGSTSLDVEIALAGFIDTLKDA